MNGEETESTNCGGSVTNRFSHIVPNTEHDAVRTVDVLQPPKCGATKSVRLKVLCEDRAATTRCCSTMAIQLICTQ